MDRRTYLSFNKKDSDKGPIAIVRGGDDDGKFIYLSDSKSEVPRDSIMSSLGLDYFFDLYNEIRNGKTKYKKKKGLSNDDIIVLAEALKSQDKSLFEDSGNSIILEKMYDRAIIDSAGNSNGSELTLQDDSVIDLVPPTKMVKGKLVPHRTNLYITGPGGSGKTTLTAKFAKNYHKFFPKAPIYLFSEVDNDDTLDKLKNSKGEKLIQRIKIGDNLVEDPIMVDALKGEPHKSSGNVSTSMVIFDDIDVIHNEAAKKEVYKIQDALLQIGRHAEIYIVSTAHMMLNYQKTRILLTESPFVTFFPGAGCSWHIEGFLKRYIGLDKKQIKKVMGLPSRWVTVHKNYPQYIIYEHGIYLLSAKS